MITLLYFFSLNEKRIPYQTLPIAKVAFLEDSSAFVCYILSLFDKRFSTFNWVKKVVDLNRNSGHQCFLRFRCKYRMEERVILFDSRFQIPLL